MKIYDNPNIVNYLNKENSKALNSYKKDNESSKLVEDKLELSAEGQRYKEIALKSNQALEVINSYKKEELEIIRERVNSNYYDREEVISGIARSILDDEEFQNLFLNDKMKNVITKYIDLREKDIEKVDLSRIKVQNSSYDQEEIYEKVAEDIINTYK